MGNFHLQHLEEFKDVKGSEVECAITIDILQKLQVLQLPALGKGFCDGPSRSLIIDLTAC